MSLVRHIASCCALLLVVIPGAVRADARPGPRELFAAGQYEAAGAAFEERWFRTGRATDGINAVVSWRVAGRYAHARSLLARIVVPKGALALRVDLLASRLTELTATLRFTGKRVDGEAVFKVDGRPAERLGQEVVVNVGRRQIVVERQGCKPTTLTRHVLPGRHEVRVPLVCDQLPGSLHVTLEGGRGGQVWIGDKAHEVKEFALAVPLPPGKHRVVVNRRDVQLQVSTVEVRSRRTSQLKVPVPLRAKKLGISLTVGSDVRGGGHGVLSTITGGLSLVGAHGLAGDRGAAFLHLRFGVAFSSVEGLDGAAYWPGMTCGWIHLLRPLWQHRLGSVLLVLDWELLLADFSATHRGGSFSDVQTSYISTMLAPLALKAGTQRFQFELLLWPGGFTYNNYRNSLQRELSFSTFSYVASVRLGASWTLFGI